MSPIFTRRARHRLPEEVERALGAEVRERVMGWTLASLPQEFLVIGAHTLSVVVTHEGAALVRLRRPWHLVDAGSFDPESSRLGLSWADDSRPELWQLDLAAAGALEVVDTFRDRVQASVVLADSVGLGRERLARVVIRRDLATGELLCQELLPAGVDRAEPGVAARLDATAAALKEQVGLP